MEKRIRIKDIAEKAGVSTGTVDRVIHRRGNVSKKVEEKVRRVMKELNYKPNIIASTLAYNRTYRIATLLPDYRSDPYWEQPRLGVDRAFDTLQHYNMVWEPHYFHLNRPADFKAKAEKILNMRPDAVLLAPVFLREGLWLIDRCRQAGIPSVKINTDIDEDHSLCYVGQDSYQSGVLAGKLLSFFLGKTELAMILNLDKETTSAQHLIDKERGIRDYFSRIYGRQEKVIKSEFADFDQPKRMCDFLMEKLDAFPQLKGIFVTNSRSYKVLECLSPEMAGELRIVGFDLLNQNLRYLRENRIAFLINQNPVQQGYQGIMNLYTHLVRKEEVEPIQYLPLDIVVTENVDYYLKREEEFQVVV